ncbi:MAG: chemotaxis protein CheW [Candidatus Zixiibacteriota bacterium]
MATVSKKKSVARKTKKTATTRATNTRKIAKKAAAPKRTKKTTPRSASAKKTAVKKAAVKKATPRKESATKKAAAKKSTVKKAAPRRAPAPKKAAPVPVAAGMAEPIVDDTVATGFSPSDDYTEDFDSLKEVLTDDGEVLIREEVVPSPVSDEFDEQATDNSEAFDEEVIEESAQEPEADEDEQEATDEWTKASDAERTVKKEIAAKQDLTGTDELQLVCFSVADEEYGVDIYRVQEINRAVAVTALPEMPPYIQGIINLRGNVIPIIDLRYRLGFATRDEDKDTRIIVLDTNGALVGLTVDSVTKVLRVSKSSMEPLPKQASTAGADFLEGIIRLEDRLIMVIDCQKVVEL